MFHSNSLEKVPQGSPEWKQARRRGIGGSDAASALGLDEYKTPLALYKEKLGEEDGFDGNWYTRRGNAMEPVLRQEYAEKTGRTVRIPEHILQHPQHQFMIVSLDGFTDDGRLLECKTATRSNGWGEPGSDQIPEKYLVQTQHSLIVTGAEFADVVVSIGGGEPRFYEVRADRELQEMIIQVENAFWQKVLNRVEPDPSTIAELKMKYEINDLHSVVATPAIQADYDKLVTIKGAMARFEEEKEAAQENIKKFLLMSGAAALVAPDAKKLVTWNTRKGSKRFNSKRLEAEKPEVYNAYVEVGEPSRTFLIK